MDSRIKRIIISIFFSFSIFMLASLPAEANDTKTTHKADPLILGVLPFRSPVALLKRFSPLRDYLQEKLGKPVILETASNFDEFVMRTHTGRYDFLLTAPHFTLLALDSGKYELKASYKKPLSAAISVRRDSNIRHLSQLQGKTISTPPEIAIITMAGKNYIARNNFKSPVTFIAHKSHNASIDALMIGKTDAAIASINPTRQYIQKGKALRIISVTSPLPGMGLLVARHLPKSIRKLYQYALLSMHKDQAGKKALKKMGYPGYKNATRKEFEAARIFLKK